MPVPERSESVERHLLRDTAYTTLLEAIVDGTLAPGEILHDGELCSWLALSRTPVRDALARLKEDGLIEMAPQRYTRVSALDPRDVRDVFPLLATVHALAADLAVSRMTVSEHEAVRQANQDYVAALRARDAEGARVADERFHGVFVAATANREITRVLERLMPRVRRLQRLMPDALPGRRSVAQHEAIAARAAAGEAGPTASAVRENWMTLGSLLDRALGQGPEG